MSQDAFSPPKPMHKNLASDLDDQRIENLEYNRKLIALFTSLEKMESELKPNQTRMPEEFKNLQEYQRRPSQQNIVYPGETLQNNNIPMLPLQQQQEEDTM